MPSEIMTGEKLQNLISDLLIIFDKSFKIELSAKVNTINFGIDINDSFTLAEFTDNVLSYVLSFPKTSMFTVKIYIEEIKSGGK
jgi:hypothetical protein